MYHIAGIFGRIDTDSCEGYSGIGSSGSIFCTSSTIGELPPQFSEQAMFL